jgi:hypothetical protein
MDWNRLPWHMPDWSWWKLWEWPGHILNWLKGWSEYREAAHRARKAKVEADVAEAGQSNVLFEVKVADMIRKFRKQYNDAEAANPGKNIVPIIERLPEDDPDVFNEAMRRMKDETRKPSPPRGFPRF